MELEDLDVISRRQINKAGARYTPAIDPGAPNIEITPVVEAFKAVGADPSYQPNIRQLAHRLSERLRWLPAQVERVFDGKVHTPATLVEIVNGLAASGVPGRAEASLKLRATLGYVSRTLSRLEERLYAEQTKQTDDEKRRALANDRDGALRLLLEVREIQTFVESPQFDLLTRNCMLLLGMWGSGKTHSLCDLTKHRMENGLPTLFHLASGLPSSVDPLQGLCDATGLATDPRALLAELQTMGLNTGVRSLIVIDGINEGNRTRWARSMPALLRLLSDFDHVGIVLSCRQPFDELIFNSRTRRGFVRVDHRGFSEIEVDAQVEFFTHYGIPAPHVPLMADEFSKPLFLKLVCESLRDRGRSHKSAYVRELASGQKGMTLVLEDFARAIGKSIERDFGLTAGACWRFLKGDSVVPRGPLVGLAPTMADSGRQSVTREACRALLQLVTGLAPDACDNLLQRMLNDGLLAEGVSWTSDRPVAVVEFPYQRFGDHVIARYLLDRYLDVSSANAIRRSLFANRPLGRIFRIRAGGQAYLQPGLASAIMLEFPERVKRAPLPAEDREVVFFLPQKRRLAAPLLDVFLEGLYWRPVDSFTQRTADIIGFYLERGGSREQRRLLETLVSLASRTGHPYSAARLHTYLARLTMSDRDLLWSEFLRSVDVDSAVYRLLDWIERVAETLADSDTATNCIRLLSLLLTTTKRSLRDRATRGLYLLGLQSPSTLFDLTQSSLAFNDPYVPERMLAACYGVAMALWTRPQGGARSVLPSPASRARSRRRCSFRAPSTEPLMCFH